MKKGELGLYNYLAMTKIDTSETENEDILYATAVHEYTHLFLTSMTTYGRFSALFELAENTCYTKEKESKKNMH